MKYPLSSLFKKLLPSASNIEKHLATTPWYEIDLFKNILRFKNPQQSFFPLDELIADMLWQDNRPFVDTINRSKFQGLTANGYSSCQITKNGWKLIPDVTSESEQVVFCMAVDAMYAYPPNEKENYDLNDIEELKSWVQYCHLRSRTYAEKDNLSIDDNGVLKVEFENEEVKEILQTFLSFEEEQANNKSSLLPVSKENQPSPFLIDSTETGQTKVEIINERYWVKIKEPGELRFYTAVGNKDALCFTFDLEARNGETRFCTSPSVELKQQMNDFIYSLLATVTVTPSDRLQCFLKDKGIV